MLWHKVAHIFYFHLCLNEISLRSNSVTEHLQFYLAIHCRFLCRMFPLSVPSLLFFFCDLTGLRPRNRKFWGTSIIGHESDTHFFLFFTWSVTCDILSSQSLSRRPCWTIYFKTAIYVILYVTDILTLLSIMQRVLYKHYFKNLDLVDIKNKSVYNHTHILL